MSTWIVVLLPLLASVVGLMAVVVGLVVRPSTAGRWNRVDGMPNVTVMVPHYNEDAARLIETLDTIDIQSYPGRLDVLVVDDGSTNDVQGHLARWMIDAHRHRFQSIVIDRNTGRKGRALDKALLHLPSDTEVIVIVDSDTLLADGALTTLVRGLWSDPQCAVACGYLVPSNPAASVFSRMQYYEYTGPLSANKLAQNHVHRVTVMAGAFVAHRRSVVDWLGGWGFWLVEDMAWTWKALARGYRSAYVAEAVAFTRCPESAATLHRQRRRWSRGQIEAFRELIYASPFVALCIFPLLSWQIARRVTIDFLPFTALALWLVPYPAMVLLGVRELLYVLVSALHVQRSANPCRQGWKEALVSPLVNRMLAVWLWLPGLMGLADAFRQVDHGWLTRGRSETFSSRRRRSGAS